MSSIKPDILIIVKAVCQQNVHVTRYYADFFSLMDIFDVFMDV